MTTEEYPEGLTVITREPHQRLRGLVLSYQGYTEINSSVLRQETPATFVPMIISWGDALGIVDPRRPAKTDRRHDFVSGLIDTYVFTESALSSGVQVNFTPIGARMFLGLPMDEIVNLNVTLDDVFGAAGRQLIERLRETDDWERRFEILDRAILDRIDASPQPNEAVILAWHRLNRSGGKASIRELAEHLGWSGKHLISQFRDQIGLPPKTVARIIRFNAAVRRLRNSATSDWANVVTECGYYDQAHLIREFREFAGLTPREYLRGQLPRLAAFKD
jgi:AraC-like DNA-binding protein